MKEVLKGAFLASLAVFVGGFVFWWSPLPYRALNQINETDRSEVVAYLRAQFPETGVYMVPSPRDAGNELRETGPAVTVHVLTTDDVMSGWGIAITGFLHLLAANFLIGSLLGLATPALAPRYAVKVIFVVLVALAMVIYQDLVEPIWWYYPWRWNLLKLVYDLIAWTIAGLVLASVITGPPAWLKSLSG